MNLRTLVMHNFFVLINSMKKAVIGLYKKKEKKPPKLTTLHF